MKNNNIKQLLKEQFDFYDIQVLSGGPFGRDLDSEKSQENLDKLILKVRKAIIKAVLAEMVGVKSQVRKVKPAGAYEHGYNHGYDDRIEEEKAKAKEILKELL